MKLKKALSLTLALVMCLAMAVPAFAEDRDTEMEKHYTISNPCLGMDGDVYLFPVGTVFTPKDPFEWGSMMVDGVVYSDQKPFTLTKTTDVELHILWLDAIYDLYSVVRGVGTDTTPEKPTEPTTPAQPEQPTTPAEPEQPTTPAEPEQPTTPAEPEQPTTPAEPEQPTAPAEPEQPVDPSGLTTVEVATASNQRLNVRSGPGTNYKIAAHSLKNGTVLQISEIQGQWGKLADGRGWVYLPATKTVSAPAEPEQPAQPETPAQPELAEGETAYTIKSGDTLSKIALDTYGNMAEYKRVVERNPDIIKDANKIYAGQVIILPAKQ